ncbi:MAG: oligosaccharide flippase family protein [Balneolaceae bacterium]
MGIVVRQSLLNSLITYTGIGLGFVLTILLYPHILDPDQYGLTRILISASMISAQFAHLGVRQSIIKYFPFFTRTNTEKHGLLFWTFLIPLVGFILFGLMFWLFQDAILNYYRQESPLFLDYYLWILPITLFILYFEVLNSYLRSLKDSTSGSIVSEVLNRVFVILFLALYFFDLIRFSHFVLLFALSYGVQPILLGFQIYRKGEFKLSPNLNILRKPLVKGISTYGLYSLLGGLTTVIVWNVDVMMLGAMSGLADTGIYAIAFYIGSVITVPQRSIEKIAAPLVSEFITEKDWDSLSEIYRKTTLNQMITGLLIFGLIWINIDLIFALLPEQYAAGKWVVFIVGIGKLFDMATGVNGTILMNSKHYRVSFYTNLFLVGVTILTNYLLIPIYGIIGAAIATALSILFYNTVKFFYVWAKMSLQPFRISSLLITLLGILTIGLITLFIDFESVILNTLVRNILFLSTFLMPLLYLNASPDLNRLIRKILMFQKP